MGGAWVWLITCRPHSQLCSGIHWKACFSLCKDSWKYIAYRRCTSVATLYAVFQTSLFFSLLSVWFPRRRNKSKNYTLSRKDLIRGASGGYNLYMGMQNGSKLEIWHERILIHVLELKLWHLEVFLYVYVGKPCIYNGLRPRIQINVMIITRFAQNCAICSYGCLLPLCGATATL